MYDRDHASALPSSGGLYSLSPFRPHTPHAQSGRRSDEREEVRTAEVEPPRGELKNFFLSTRRRKNKGLFSPAFERDEENGEE